MAIPTWPSKTARRLATHVAPAAAKKTSHRARESSDKLNVRHIAQALAAAVGDQPVSFARWRAAGHRSLAASPSPRLSRQRRGGGLGSGPDSPSGRRCALKGSGRLAVSVLGDWDCPDGMSAF